MTFHVKWVGVGLATASIASILFFLWTAPSRQTGTVHFKMGDANPVVVIGNALTKYPKVTKFVVDYDATRHTRRRMTYDKNAQTVSLKSDDPEGLGLDYSNVSDSALISMADRGQDIDNIEVWGARQILPPPQNVPPPNFEETP